MNPVQTKEKDSNLEGVDTEQTEPDLSIPPSITIHTSISPITPEATANEEEYVMYLKFLSTSHETDLNQEPLHSNTIVPNSFEGGPSSLLFYFIL